MFESTIVRGKVFTDNSGISYEIPVLLTSSGFINVLLEYLISHWDTRSPSWMLKVTASVRLFLEYQAVHSDYSDEQAVFQNFRHRLLTGTVSASAGDDPTGLWWAARGPVNTKHILRNLTDLFNWWAYKNPTKTNPAETWCGGAHDLRLAEAAYLYRRNSAFLGNTWSSVEEIFRGPSVEQSAMRIDSPPRTEQSDQPAFPDDRILDLIFYGFKVGRRHNYRDMLITLLMNGAGFRVSEPFHLYLWDVKEDPIKKGSALVLIHHPAWGDAPVDPNWLDTSGRRKKGTRSQYLAERFGLSSRDWQMSTSAAGWKGGMHEEKFGGYYKQAYWFVPEFGEIFWNIWNLYVEQVMRIAPSARNHPFAFVNIARHPKGEFYKLGKFQDSHAAAVRRIGLVPAKHLGTTEHGHRHAYGLRLRKAEISEEMIRRCMHHSDIKSQAVYTKASFRECLEHLTLAADRLNGMVVERRQNIVTVTRADIERF